ncbi:TetR family transcriptional regulator [Pseudomaricurvus alkylphenolicus]|uniref:TetR/AcrR family transcriptional regulator n=1 Tax=Pseudomaricurvus alkylphenolicus TaxID=1306991 RepID=UPI0014236353|nr:TetR family transcriptional regulator [Pseudomaricurvus alkylphenolicus]NIB39124.1 TetR family transcriptional regulator [Pseudomaricurvus alkylphenolicus]
MAHGRFDELLQYRGRAAKRSDSRIRRKAILEAALRVIEREGVRGVKHRAVAQEAEVPLAATTYYFVDIQALLHDAFVHYVETRLSADSSRLQAQSMALLEPMTDSDLQQPLVRRQIADRISSVLLQHVRSQVERANERRVEVAFRQEAMRNPDLARVIAVPHQAQLQAIEEFLQRVGSSDCTGDAQVVMGTLLYMEYQLILEAVDWQVAAQTLKRLAEGLLRLPEESSN